MKESRTPLLSAYKDQTRILSPLTVLIIFSAFQRAYKKSALKRMFFNHASSRFDAKAKFVLKCSNIAFPGFLLDNRGLMNHLIRAS